MADRPNTARMREAIHAARAKQAPPPQTKPPPPSKQKGTPPVERLDYGCGHPMTLEKAKRFPCPDCWFAARNKRAKARREKAKARPPARGRLPDGAAFSVTYDAAAMTWTGTLTVPGGRTYTATASAVFKLLARLDDQFRKDSAPHSNDHSPP